MIVFQRGIRLYLLPVLCILLTGCVEQKPISQPSVLDSTDIIRVFDEMYGFEGDRGSPFLDKPIFQNDRALFRYFYVYDEQSGSLFVYCIYRVGEHSGLAFIHYSESDNAVVHGPLLSGPLGLSSNSVITEATCSDAEINRYLTLFHTRHPSVQLPLNDSDRTHITLFKYGSLPYAYINGIRVDPYAYTNEDISEARWRNAAGDSYPIQNPSYDAQLKRVRLVHSAILGAYSRTSNGQTISRTLPEWILSELDERGEGQ